MIAGIANVPAINKINPAGRLNGVPCVTGDNSGHPLIALAMIVGANVKKGMLLPAIPFADLSRLRAYPLRRHGFICWFPALFQDGYEPASRGDGVGLQQLQGRGGTHFR